MNGRAENPYVSAVLVVSPLLFIGGRSARVTRSRKPHESARQTLENERLGYTEALGLPKLRERIARHMSERYGVGVSLSAWW